jgi:predicted nucleotidyltransferase
MTTSSIIEVLRRNNGLLKKHHVRRIGLFGSLARGEGAETSDIDLLVEFDESAFGRNFLGYFDTITSLSSDLHAIFNKPVDLVTKEMLSPYIADNVIKEVKYIDEA